MENAQNIQSGVQAVRASNLRKASELRKAGYKSSIHALPHEVRTRLDQLLTHRVSPREALSQLWTEFPHVTLPSPKAVENYRNRHHRQSLSKDIAKLAKEELTMDMKKLQIEKTVGEQMLRIARDIYPRVVNRVVVALDREDEIKLPLRFVNESVQVMNNLTKLINDFCQRNGMSAFAEEAQPEEDKEEKLIKSKQTMEKFVRLLGDPNSTLFKMRQQVVMNSVESELVQVREDKARHMLS